MVNYTTYESEEEKNNVGESKNPADKLVENSKIKVGLQNFARYIVID